MFPRVREVIRAYGKTGLLGVELYFNQEGMQIDPSTWCGHVKEGIDEGHKISVTIELELIKDKFNFYKDVSEKEGDSTGTNSVDGKGHTDNKGETNREGETR